MKLVKHGVNTYRWYCNEVMLYEGLEGEVLMYGNFHHDISYDEMRTAIRFLKLLRHKTAYFGINKTFIYTD